MINGFNAENKLLHTFLCHLEAANVKWMSNDRYIYSYNLPKPFKSDHKSKFFSPHNFPTIVYFVLLAILQFLS